MIGMVRRMAWALLALALFAVAFALFTRTGQAGGEYLDALAGGLLLGIACGMLWEKVLRP